MQGVYAEGRVGIGEKRSYPVTADSVNMRIPLKKLGKLGIHVDAQIRIGSLDRRQGRSQEEEIPDAVKRLNSDYMAH